ncbi:hypothetical protein [Rickettsiella endosymbiont of Dermanyssus gallinae]|uniref:hypothetical protein n=1 Tax=Rickettsiella endosymbiont of Dermanyssus gallinae TaxID=2856608 RepID=UPI001C529088|nr:hypothetical protein [Rickettsiella endosymbiont of Dermanyssus gallinae]
MIHSAEDFYSVLKHLNFEQRTKVFENVKGKLLSIIFRADDFYLILETLNYEQRTTTFNFLKQKLPSLIRCSDDFYMILENLNFEQRTAIFNPVKEGLFFSTAYDFYIITKNLNAEQRVIIFGRIKDSLSSMIFNSDDVYYIFKHLNFEQHAITFKNVKEKLLFTINHVDDLTTVFSVLSTEQRLDVLKTFEEKLPFIIHNADAYNAIIRDLNSSERAYLDQLLKFHKYNLLAIDSKLISFEDCLPGPSGHHRRKRNTLEEACQSLWEDVDKFNEEKEKPRDFNKIKINSDRFIAFLENPSLSEARRVPLFELADKRPVMGTSQDSVDGLIKYKKNLRYLHKVGHLSSMATQGMMLKNTLRDFFQEDYKGVAINIGFIAGGQGFAKWR